MPEDPKRVEGVDFTAINPVLNEVSYPITTTEFVDQYGGQELGRTNADPITVAELFEYMGEDSFDSPEEVRQTFLSQMPRGTAGRPSYSDRGGATPVETKAAKEATEQTSADLQRGNSTERDSSQE